MFCIYIFIILYFIHISRVFPTGGKGIIMQLAKNLLIHPAPGIISSRPKISSLPTK